MTTDFGSRVSAPGALFEAPPGADPAEFFVTRESIVAAPDDKMPPTLMRARLAVISVWRMVAVSPI